MTSRQSGMLTLQTASCFLLLLGHFPLRSPAFSQVITASLNRNISDPTGALIPGALVVLKSTGTGVEHKATSNATGAYSFDFLPIGAYSLEVTASGFQGQRQA